ncbi:hypothetical protein PR048_002122 [Dryococelus australis]|uniref:Uncharacterized protein n=1 Tax=Dryococelus australis TaxID=614101 RepID=A0ABQ9IJ99_9NEOP|nr:hypothetical protein PR048_002122 [Dryococelus australis]
MVEEDHNYWWLLSHRGLARGDGKLHKQLRGLRAEGGVHLEAQCCQVQAVADSAAHSCRSRKLPFPPRFRTLTFIRTNKPATVRLSVASREPGFRDKPTSQYCDFVAGYRFAPPSLPLVPGMGSNHLPPRLTRFDSWWSRSRILESGNHVGQSLWSVGFRGDLPFPPPLHSSAAPYSSHFTLVGSHDPYIKNRLYLSAEIERDMEITYQEINFILMLLKRKEDKYGRRRGGLVWREGVSAIFDVMVAILDVLDLGALPAVSIPGIHTCTYRTTGNTWVGLVDGGKWTVNLFMTSAICAILDMSIQAIASGVHSITVITVECLEQAISTFMMASWSPLNIYEQIMVRTCIQWRMGRCVSLNMLVSTVSLGRDEPVRPCTLINKYLFVMSCCGDLGRDEPVHTCNVHQ